MLFRPSGAFCRYQFLADYTISMFGFYFRQGQADRLIGHIDASLGEHILDVAVAQSEADIESDGLLDDDARKAMAAV